MTPGVRVIRFARVADRHHPGPQGSVMVACVLLHEESVPAGHIVTRARTWHYLLADGTPSGLTSTVSRPDLEQQIVVYHFGPEPVIEDAGTELPLAM